MQRVHIIISGDVQGVGFRAWVHRHAQDLYLTGWVRNREDGTVEIIAEGAGVELEKFIQHCQNGPDTAWVEHADARHEKATGEFLSFDVAD